jgi:hypothetical protein
MNHEAEGNTEDAAELDLGEGEILPKPTVTSPSLKEGSKSSDEKMNTGNVPEAPIQPLEERSFAESVGANQGTGSALARQEGSPSHLHHRLAPVK